MPDNTIADGMQDNTIAEGMPDIAVSYKLCFISKVFSPLTFSFLLDKTFYQCLACRVAVRCNDCGVEKMSRADRKKMTSQAIRDRSKCYHSDRQTFKMCDDMTYFNVNWRQKQTKPNLQPNCLGCKKSLLWVAKKKDN